MKRVTIVALIAAGASCGGASHTKNVGQQTAPTDHNSHAEIAQLWAQIRGWRSQAGLDRLEPKPASKTTTKNIRLTQLRRECSKPAKRPPKSRRCTDVCNLADAICDNATRICEIAAQIPENMWAQEKCTSGKTSCFQARKRCCQCTD